MDLCEFIAEEELIEIVPRFRYNKQLNLITGDFGPFLPAIPVKVPIWLALNLYRQHKCTIILPEWMRDLEQLKDEQDNQNILIKMPSEHWREHLYLLREATSSVLPNFSSLIEKRDSILKNSVHELFNHTANSKTLMITDVTLSNVTQGELQSIKTFIQKSFHRLQQLRRVHLQNVYSSASNK